MAFLRTVLGDIDASEMGVTLSHEHLVCDSSVWLQAPQDDVGRVLAEAQPSIDNLWWMRQFPNSNRSVLQMRDEDAAVEEVGVFAQHGGRTVVELSCSPAMGRDVEALARISRRSGVNVVASTGLYVAP